MSTVKRIVCLANSRKPGGSCVAGKESNEEKLIEWVRPVSSRPKGEVSFSERRCTDGGDPKVLDVLEIPLLEHSPKSYQSENWILDPARRWVKVGRVTYGYLEHFVDQPDYLWSNGFSTYHGINDRIPVAQAAELATSLYLVHLDGLALRVFSPGERFGNPTRRLQANFSYRGVTYGLRVTDPAWEKRYCAQGEGEYAAGECLACVSLGEPNTDGYCYKLVAGLILPDS